MSKKQTQSTKHTGKGASQPAKQPPGKGPVLSRRPPRQPGR